MSEMVGEYESVTTEAATGDSSFEHVENFDAMEAAQQSIDDHIEALTEEKSGTAHRDAETENQSDKSEYEKTVDQLTAHYGGQWFVYKSHQGTVSDIIDLCPAVGIFVKMGFDRTVRWLEPHKAERPIEEAKKDVDETDLNDKDTTQPDKVLPKQTLEPKPSIIPREAPKPLRELNRAATPVAETVQPAVVQPVIAPVMQVIQSQAPDAAIVAHVPVVGAENGIGSTAQLEAKSDAVIAPTQNPESEPVIAAQNETSAGNDTYLVPRVDPKIPVDTFTEETTPRVMPEAVMKSDYVVPFVTHEDTDSLVVAVSDPIAVKPTDGIDTMGVTTPEVTATVWEFTHEQDDVTVSPVLQSAQTHGDDEGDFVAVIENEFDKPDIFFPIEAVELDATASSAAVENLHENTVLHPETPDAFSFEVLQDMVQQEAPLEQLLVTVIENLTVPEQIDNPIDTAYSKIEITEDILATMPVELETLYAETRLLQKKIDIVYTSTTKQECDTHVEVLVQELTELLRAFGYAHPEMMVRNFLQTYQLSSLRELIETLQQSLLERIQIEAIRSRRTQQRTQSRHMTLGRLVLSVLRQFSLRAMTPDMST